MYTHTHTSARVSFVVVAVFWRVRYSLFSGGGNATISLIVIIIPLGVQMSWVIYSA